MLIKNRAFYILMDIAVILISFVVAFVAREGVMQERLPKLFSEYEIFILLVYFIVILFYQVKKPLMKRNSWKELRVVGTINIQMALLLTLILYLLHAGTTVPRSFYILFFIINTVFMYLGRIFLKKIMLVYYRKAENRRRLVLFANEENVLRMMQKYVTSYMYDYEAIGVITVCGHESDGDPDIKINRVKRGDRGTYMESVPGPVEEYLKREAIDEALISMPESDNKSLRKLIHFLENLGIAAHVTTNTFGLGSHEKSVEDFGIYHVLTYSPRIFEPTELFLKRLMDIVGGLVGVICTLILSVFVAPAIYLESPGPVVFKQVRIGRNGRRFHIYKFRSMYMDAEERKKELMAQNEMNGLMFKIKDDPRITKVGKFIRKTSIDEFPQFFNVLAGDMSLVGTRPPTEDEFMQYSERHKRRLSLKPGITGMWQVKGRSDISDFEEIVNLDLEYIDNWSIWLDIRLLFETVYVVLSQKGAF